MRMLWVKVIICKKINVLDLEFQSKKSEMQSCIEIVRNDENLVGNQFGKALKLKCLSAIQKRIEPPPLDLSPRQFGILTSLRRQHEPT
jgi:hypothetical protein